MSELKARLTEERIALGNKCSEVKILMNDPYLKEHEPHQLNLLKIQYRAMLAYWETLGARIALIP